MEAAVSEEGAPLTAETDDALATPLLDLSPTLVAENSHIDRTEEVEDVETLSLHKPYSILPALTSLTDPEDTEREVDVDVRVILDDVIKQIVETLTTYKPPKYTGTMAAYILQQMYWRKVEKEELQLQQYEQVQHMAAIKIQSIVRLFITCARLRQQWTEEALSIMKEEERKRKAKLKAKQNNHIKKLITYEQEKKLRLEKKLAEKIENEEKAIARIISSKHKSKEEVDKFLQKEVILKLTENKPSRKKSERINRHVVEFTKKHGQIFTDCMKVSSPSSNLLKPTLALEWNGLKKSILDDMDEVSGSISGSRYMCINVSKSNQHKESGEGEEGEAEAKAKQATTATGGYNANISKSGKFTSSSNHNCPHSPSDSVSSFHTSLEGPNSIANTKQVANNNNNNNNNNSMYMKSTVSNLFREAENFEVNATKFLSSKSGTGKLMKFAPFHSDVERRERSCLHTYTKKKELKELCQNAMESIASVKAASVVGATQRSPEAAGDAQTGWGKERGREERKSDNKNTDINLLESGSIYSVDSSSSSRSPVISVKARGLGAYNFLDPAALLDSPGFSRSFNSSFITSPKTESQSTTASPLSLQSEPSPLPSPNKRVVELELKSQLPSHPLPKITETNSNDYKEIQEMYRARSLLQQHHDIDTGYFGGTYDTDELLLRRLRKEGYQTSREMKEKAAREEMEAIRRIHKCEIQRRGNVDDYRLEVLRKRLKAQQEAQQGRLASVPAPPERPLGKPSGPISPRKVSLQV